MCDTLFVRFSNIAMNQATAWILLSLLCISQFHLRPAPPLPPLLQGICLPWQSWGWGICKFFTARVLGICQPRGHSQAPDTYTVAYQNITTRRVLQEKKQIGSSVKDRNKFKRVVKACSRFYAFFLHCLPSQNYMAKTWAVDVNQRFLVIESNLSWYYLKKILSYV